MRFFIKASLSLLAILSLSADCIGQSFNFLPDDYLHATPSEVIKGIIGGTISDPQNFHSTYVFPVTAHDRISYIEGQALSICDLWPSFQYKSLQDIVEVRIDKGCTKVSAITTPMEYTFVFNVTIYTLAALPWPNNGNNISGTPGGYTTQTFTPSITLSMSPQAGTTYKDKGLFRVSGGQKMDVTLSAVLQRPLATPNATPTPIALTQIPDCITFETKVSAQRVDDITGSTIAITNNAGTYSTTDRMLDLHWSFPCTGSASRPNPKAVEYEVEWTYVDDYQVIADGSTPATNSFAGTGNIIYDFGHNATRIRCKTTAYSIPVIYERGAIVYRVRTVSPDPQDYSKIKYGAWTSPDAGSIPSSASAATLAPQAFIITSGYADKLNWQYSINFAEEGKYKHVINYLDGSLKSRQTQTKINTDNNYIIAVDHAFDYEGRPAITSLPTPIAGQSQLAYNGNVLLKANGHAIAAQDFDYRGVSSGSTLPAPANTTCAVPATLSLPVLASSGSGGISLAETYYSANNPLVNDPLHRFVPDAGGYPYAQTIFAPENAGKVLAQGGPGLTFQAYTGGHPTTYDYSTPDQPEIDRLLGTEAGSAQFYPKTITTDPNGQASVTIINKYGKPVISCLAGTAPASMKSLNPPPATTLTADLLSNFTQDRQQDRLIKADNSFSLDDASPVTLAYTASVKPFYVCGTLGTAAMKYLQTGARFSIGMLDGCGSPQLTPNNPYTQAFGQNGVVASATVPAAQTLSASILSGAAFSKGVYTYTKSLSFDKDAMLATIDNLIAANPHVYGMNGLNCNYTTQQEFIFNEVQKINTSCTPLPGTPVPDNYCDAIRKQMKDELWPGKKYGAYVASNGKFLNDAPNSIFTVQTVQSTANSLITNVNGTTDQCQVSNCSNTHSCAYNQPDKCSCPDGAHPFNQPCCVSCLVNHCKCIVFPQATFTTTTSTPIYSNTAVNCTPAGNMNWQGPYVNPNQYSSSNIATYYNVSQPCNLGYIHHATIYNYATGSNQGPGLTSIVDGSHHGYPITGYNTSTSTTTSILVNSKYRYQSDCITSSITINGVPLKDVDPQTLIDNFSDAIAEALLPLHPEYCKLANCNDGAFVNMLTQQKTTTYTSNAAGAAYNEMDNIATQDPQYINAPAALKFQMLHLPGWNPATTYDPMDPMGKTLEVLALQAAYCNSGNKAEPDVCKQYLYTTQIANKSFINDDLRQRFWDNFKALYLVSHNYWKQKSMDASGTGCAPCSSQQMTLIGEPVVPVILSGINGISGDIIDPNILTGLDPNVDIAAWYGVQPGANVFGTSNGSYTTTPPSQVGATAGKMFDAFLEPIRAYVNTYPAPAGYASQTDALKAALMAYTAPITPDYVKSLLPVNDEWCNAYLLNYTIVNPSHEEQNPYMCGDQAMYADLKAFVNNKLLGLGVNQGALITLDATAANGNNRYEQLLINKLNNAVPAQTLSNINVYVTQVAMQYNAYNVVNPYSSYTAYQLSGTGFPTTIYISALPDQTNAALPGLPAQITDAYCVNDRGLAAQGYITQGSAVLEAGGSRYVLFCKDAFVMSVPQDPEMAKAVNCWDVSKTVANYMAQHATYGYPDAYTHPLFITALNNYLNYNLHKNYTYDQYEDLMKGCALSDRTDFRRGAAQVVVSTTNPAGFISYLQSLATLPPGSTNADLGMSADLIHAHYSDAAGNHTFYLDMSALQTAKQWRAYNALSAYAPVMPAAGTADAAEVLLPANSPVTGASLPPASLSLSGQGQVTLYDNAGTGTTYDRYTAQIVNSAGLTPAGRSAALADLKAYITASQPSARVYWKMELLRSSDYAAPAKQAYLNYVFTATNPIATHSEAVQRLDAAAAALKTQMGVSAGTLNYRSPFCTGTLADLYVYPQGGTVLTSGPLVDALSGYGALVNATAGSVPGAGSGAYKREIRKVSGAYWFVYDKYTPGYALYNAYVLPPQGVDISGYQLDMNSLVPAQCDAQGNVYGFEINATNGGAPIACRGYTDFPVMTGGAKVANVLLYHGSNEVCYEPSDCEYQLLAAAIEQGKGQYSQYLAAQRTDLLQRWTGFLADPANVTETLSLTRTDNKYQYTLYYYDRAGNKMKTVPPQGVTPLSGSTLSSVNGTRLGYNPALTTQPTLTSHQKISYYYYNSFNQVSKQVTPDAGVTTYYYDDKGRVAFSQNARQLAKSNVVTAGVASNNYYYSYVLYDGQGRLTETGEACIGEKNVSGGRPAIIGSLAQHLSVSYATDIVAKVEGLTRTDVVYTVYDAPSLSGTALNSPWYSLTPQENLRRRTAAVLYYGVVSSALSPGAYASPDYAVHYSYDALGNVKTLTHEIAALSDLRQRYKRIDYDYDVLSGRMNAVSYNRGYPDQYYHRYGYDADNRVVRVETSDDGEIWATDAQYDYYKHGPLARVRLGDNQVQSMEYAYTLQGWLKAINGDLLNPNKDMGHNGMYTPGGATDPTARDVVAHDLQYYNGDYTAINASTPVEQLTGTQPLAANRQVFNGNIARQYTSIAKLNPVAASAAGDVYGMERSYQYDQLNRIAEATYQLTDNMAGALASDNSAVGGDPQMYRSRYGYDRDGNILHLERWNGVGTKMDDLSYSYQNPQGQGNSIHNKLQDVLELVNNGTTGLDIKPATMPTLPGTTTPVKTYQYDETGNLITDNRDHLSITWNLYGKPTTIVKTAANAGGPASVLSFRYDGAGNRLSRDVATTTGATEQHDGEYYVRDGAGNVLAVYKLKSQYQKQRVIRQLTADAVSDYGGTVYSGYLSGLAGDKPLVMATALTEMAKNAPEWVQGLTSTKSADYYLLSDDGLVRRLLTDKPDYIDDLRKYGNEGNGGNEGNEGGSGDAIIAAAVKDADPKALTTLLVRIVSGTDSVAAKAVLQHFGEAMPKQARELWEPVNGGGAVGSGSYHEEDAAGSAQNLYTAMGGEVRRESEMASKMGQLLAGEDAKDMRQVFAAAITGDEAIFGSPVLRSGEGGATTPFDGDIMAMLKNDGNRQMLSGFLGQWDPAAAWVADNVSREQQLNIICQQEPALVQASLITDGGEAGLDALSAGLAAEGSITIGGYAAGLDGAGLHPRTTGTVTSPGDPGDPDGQATAMGLVSEELTLGEHHIYGAQRLGIRYYDGNTGNDGTAAHSTGVTNEGTGLRNVWVYGDVAHSYYNLNNKQAWYSYGYGDMVKATVAAYTNGWNGWADPLNGAHVNGWEPTALVNGYMAGRALGWTHYEITDHLGDVLATILDRKTGAATSHSANYNYGYEAITGVGNTGVLTLNTYAQTGVAAYDYFKADVVSANDVYPGGMPMAERTYAFVGGVGMGVAGYRYGSQGQPKDDEVYGVGMMSVFKFRMQDVRLNRFWTPDPLEAKYPHNSAYAFSENRMIDGRELEGLECVADPNLALRTMSGTPVIQTPVSFDIAMHPLGTGPTAYWWSYVNGVNSAYNHTFGALFNGIDQTIVSLGRGSFLSDFGAGAKNSAIGLKNAAVASWNYTVNTPILQQAKDAVSPQAFQGYFEFGAMAVAGNLEMPQVNVGLTAPVGSAGAVTAAKGGFDAVGAYKNAISPFKGGNLTNAGRAVTKHPEYFGFESTEALMGAYRTPGAINNLASSRLKDILRNGVSTSGGGGRYPNGWTTYTLPNGNAATFHLDGRFIGWRGFK